MADDRQIPPEDENIPDWLRDHPLADDESQPEDQTVPPAEPSDETDEEFLAFGKPEEDDPLSFLQDVGGTPATGKRDTQTMEPVGGEEEAPGSLWDEDDAGDLPRAEELRGMTGQLPWMAGLSDDRISDDAPVDPAQLRGLTDQLPWLDESDQPLDEAGPASLPDIEPPLVGVPPSGAVPDFGDASDQSAADAVVPDWVSAGLDDAAVDEAVADAEDAEAPPDWLSMADGLADDSDDAAPAEDALPDWIDADAVDDLPAAEPTVPEPASEAPPDWIASAEALPEDADDEFPPEAIAEDAEPDWVLGDTGDLDLPEEDDSLSYDEWMHQQEEAEHEPTEEELLAEEVPDWFGDLPDDDAVDEDSAAPAAPAGAEFVPDWYFGLEDDAGVEAKPDWLKTGGLTADALTAQPVIPETPAAPADDMPDWFDEIAGDSPVADTGTPDDTGAPAEAEPPAPAESAAEEEAVGSQPEDWFSAFEEDMEPPAAPQLEPELDAGEMPDWLSELDPQLAEQEEEPLDIGQPVTTDMVLQQAEDEDDFMALIDEELGEGDVLDTLGVSGELPELMPDDLSMDFDQLLKDSQLPPESSPGLPDVPAAEGGDDLAASDMPDWMSRAQVGGFSAVRSTLGGEETPVDELSDRLKALRERSGKAAENVPAAEGDTLPADQLLADVAGSLPPTLTVDAASGREAVLDIRLEEAQQARVDALAALLGIDDSVEDGPRDPEAEAQRIRQAATRARARSRRKPMRVLVTLVLLAAVIAPFFVDVSGFLSLPETALTASEHGALDGVIESLEPGAQVLVGFEYGPTAAGEMDTLTDVLMTHLLVRGLKPVLVSTNPAGVLHARNVMATLARDPYILARLGRSGDPLTMPDDYVILPYLPGGMVGLRALTATSTDVAALDQGLFVVDVAGNPTGLDVEFLQTSFDMIVVFGERGEDVRQWVEQVGEPIKLPMAAAVAVSAEPIARPYLQSGQLVGLLAGYRDAYKYNVVLGDLLDESPTEAPAPTETAATEEPFATPTPEVDEAAADEATEEPTEVPTLDADEATGTAQAELTATIPPSATPRVFITATPAPEGAAVSDGNTPGRTASRASEPLPDRPDLDTRWYSMTLGAFAAAALISAGALLNILRWIRRRREP